LLNDSGTEIWQEKNCVSICDWQSRAERHGLWRRIPSVRDRWKKENRLADTRVHASLFQLAVI
jgi:hypothetical protein